MTLAMYQSRINTVASSMEDPQSNHLPSVDTEQQELLFVGARNLLSAWVDLFSLSEEEIKGLVVHMVRRGEVTEQQGQQLIDYFKSVREESETC